MAKTESRLYRTVRAWCIQHPVIDGAACGVAFFAASLLIVAAFPAWAAVSIPITERIVINLDDLHPWVSIAVAVAVYLKMRKTDQRVAETAVGIAIVQKQTDGVLEKVAAMAKREGAVEGERKGVLAGESAARVLAEGQQQGIASERASVAASGNQQGGGKSPPEGKSPLPVADDRTATAGERVAEATERSAEAHQRVASAAEDKK